MKHTVVKIAVIESEAGWGRKLGDYMVCLTIEDALAFRSEFNSKNSDGPTPYWYMQAEGDLIAMDVTEAQYEALKSSEKARMWLSSLRKV